MNRFGNWVATIAITASLIVPAAGVHAAEKTFSDVPEGHEAAEPIYRLVEKDVISGYGDGTFGPDNQLTREQAASILTKEMDLSIPEEKVTDYFDDVSADNEHAKYIAALAEADIMKGKNNRFNPDQNMTREQMASVLVEGYDLKDGENNVDVNLSNVSEVHQESVQTLANLDITNQLDDFRPAENVTRSQFAIFLERTANDNVGEDVETLLNKALENELNLESYEMEANANVGITLPESIQTEPEFDMIAGMLENIEVDISGSYQKDPMMMDTTVDVTLQADEQMTQTITIPMIMTEDKMWMKMPQMPGEEVPEEIDDKYIEYDMDELAGEEIGQPSMDMDTQMELAQAIQKVFLDHFSEDYYDIAEAGDYDIPENIDAKQVVKFNLDDEELKPFAETLLTGFMPEIFDILEQDDYAEALGLTEQELQVVQDELEDMTDNIEEITSALDDMVTVNTFEEYSVINQNDVIENDTMNLDLDITEGDETVGLNMSFNQLKKNIGEEVTIETPASEEVITADELEELVDDMYGDIDDLEDLEDFEDMEELENLQD